MAIVTTLDVRGTHVNNPDCKMRTVQHPNSQHWYCVDCGLPIMAKSIAAATEDERVMQEHKCNHEKLELLQSFMPDGELTIKLFWCPDCGAARRDESYPKKLRAFKTPSIIVHEGEWKLPGERRGR